MMQKGRIERKNNMDIGCQGWLEKIKKQTPQAFSGYVLDIGALDINGSAKDYFSISDNDSYIGIDMQEGEGVDIQMNAHDIKDRFEANSVDVVVCMNTFEHDDKWWITLENINYVLKKGGYFIFASPTYNFPIHNHPSDYYRFLEPAVREVILEGYEVLDIEEVYSKKIDDPSAKHGWRGVNPIICGMGKKK